MRILTFFSLFLSTLLFSSPVVDRHVDSDALTSLLKGLGIPEDVNVIEETQKKMA